ncbi:23S rRNA (adenine(2503)-C(2))-methyltransferase [Candidatus Epulonipiscioides gigas]|nr:23S rRNA (adenine(2503)-C(2))-methyltransferase [Epulopiscium sp. SCG-C07WGA-EpuloA2]
MEEINSLSFIELEKVVKNLSENSFRAKQLFNWFHEKLVYDYDKMTNLSLSLRNKLKEKYPLYELYIVQKLVSNIDGTKKYLFKLQDGNIIESVLMKYKHGASVCISTQVGCRMGCKFCASTIDGLVRNLTPAEMLGQVYSIINDTNEKVSNIVMMGTGEPLENYENMLKFLELINNEQGQNIGIRHITISTCGIAPKILELADLNFGLTLAISLHATTNDKRCKIMPITNKYSLEDILDAVKIYITKTNRRVTFEYGLILGKNDSQEDAKELVTLLKGLNCHVNLIPINTIDEKDYKASSTKNIAEFAKILNAQNIQTTIRRKLGEDIDAACGQLRRRFVNL